jgi:hypothetical protein
LEGDSWNSALVDRIAKTFIQGIERLKKMEALRFRLIEYIPVPSDFSHEYCKRIANRIISGLKDTDILWSRSGMWISPSCALMTPSEFFVEGTPLLDDDDILRSHPSRKFISNEYAESSLLRTLGCIPLNLHSVRQIIQRRDFPWSDKSNEWLTKCFVYLSRSVTNDRDHLLQLRFLKSRKVDGSIVWLSKTDHVVLPASTIQVPDYIDLSTLDSELNVAISRNHNARYFVTARLGITDISYGYIATQIINTHKQIACATDCAQILINHAQYLSEIGFQTDSNPFQYFRTKLQSAFRFLDHKEGHDIAANVVQDSEFNIGDGRKYRLSQIESHRIRFLNSQYASMTQLLLFFDIPRLPPLAMGDRLSPFYEFDVAPKTQGDNRLLHLLMDREIWKPLSASTKNKLYSELRRLHAKCENGTFQDLESCYLRTSQVTSLLIPGMNVLDLTEPDHAKWELLINFGVTLVPDAKLYLEKLRQFKCSQDVSDVSTFKDEVTKIYLALLRYYKVEDQKLIRFHPFFAVIDLRDSFNEDGLLLSDVDSVGISWGRPSDVLIDIPSFVLYTRRFPDLKMNATHKNAFCEILGIENWSDERHLPAELANFQNRVQVVSPETCRYIFLTLKQFASHVSEILPDWMTQALHFPVFPIKQPDSTKSFACCDETVFVPDSAPLNQYLKDKVRVLDFGGEDVYAILPLLRRLPLKFISAYESQNDIQLGGIPSLHPTANILLGNSRSFLAR